MKIYSEITKEFYDDVKTCQEAEAAFEAMKVEEAAKLKAEEERVATLVENEKAQVSKKKKELSDAIEKAEEARVAALLVYETEKVRAQEIIQEAQKQADEILSLAAKKVRETSEAKMDAVAAFNDAFGPYKTVLTGAKAVEEYNRIVNQFSKLWNNFWVF